MAVKTLDVFVPSNRLDPKGRRTHVDGWDEYIKAVNKSRLAGNALEQENVANVAEHTSLAMREQGFEPLDVPALVDVTFIEINRRRDVSNIYGGLKWVLDGLSRPRGTKRLGAGAIVDDSPAWCEVFTRVGIDKDKPGVSIEVTPFPQLAVARLTDDFGAALQAHMNAISEISKDSEMRTETVQVMGTELTVPRVGKGAATNMHLASIMALASR